MPRTEDFKSKHKHMISMVMSMIMSIDISINGYGKGTKELPSGSLVHCFLIVERLEEKDASLVLQKLHLKNLLRKMEADL